MADFERAFAQAIEIEGGYKLTDHKDDRGKQTYAGISRVHNPDWPGWQHIDAGLRPPTQLVRALYHAKYWLPVCGDEIEDQDVAEAVFLSYINGKASAKVLQIVLGVQPDGSIGPKTIAALNASGREHRDLLLALFFIGKVDRYRQICNKDRTQVKWLLGWINRIFKEHAIG